MSGVLTGYMATVGVSLVNEFYNKGTSDISGEIKIVVLGGIAIALADLVAQIPDMAAPVQLFGWLAFAGLLLSNAQSPSPIENLLSITGNK